MAEITREQIEELRRLLTRATRGPWEVRYSPRSEEDCVVVGPRPPSMAYAPCILADDYNGFGNWPVREADHLLVAAMRNALPALLDMAEKVIAEPSDPKPTSDLLSRLASAQGEASAQRPAIEGSPSFEVGTTSEPPLTQISLKG